MKTEDMCFRSVSIEDRAEFLEKTACEDTVISNYSFADYFVWSGFFVCSLGRIGNCLIYKSREKDMEYYSFPLGGDDDDKEIAIRTLIEYTASDGKKLIFFPLTDTQREFFEQHFGGTFEIDNERKYADYYYDSHMLAELLGRKLSAKRNHINAFEKLGDWHFDRITQSNKAVCLEIENEWITLNSDDGGALLRYEKNAIETALEFFDELELFGGILYLDERPVAFSIGEKLNADTIVVKFEKALSDIPGAFQMINREFAACFGREYKYINREEDLGDPGLRRAKSSYVPFYLENKHCAYLTGFSHPQKSDLEDVIRIWQEAFGDEREYIEFFLNERFNGDNMLCLRADGKIRSFICLLPARIKGIDADTDVLYVYAVATEKQYRKRGFITSIIKHAYEHHKKPLILLPADSEKKVLYGKMGFAEAFKTIDISIKAAENDAGQAGYEVISHA